MENFRNKKYEISLSGIPKGTEVTFCFLTDLHGALYGDGQEELIAEIKKTKPDAILIGGDMIIRRKTESLSAASDLVTALASSFPVFYAMGNHETRQRLPGKERSGYRKYEKKLKQAGVRFLYNSSAILTLRGCSIRIYGLELPLVPWYKKPFVPALKKEALDYYLNPCDTQMPAILLAHNPYFADTYFDWGADLTLCGHFHGGVLRFNEHLGLVSPMFRLFPRFCCGDFYQGEQCVLISGGLGEHTIRMRIHNPREILTVTLRERGETWPSM